MIEMERSGENQCEMSSENTETKELMQENTILLRK